jgi:glyceraldehyde 3-phosphate dehydrogenase (phosphorylating)
MIRVAINGYGRIGRLAHRVILESHSKEIDLVAINAGSSTDVKGWAYLLKYDTSYGTLKNEVSSDEKNLIVDDKKIPILLEKDPSKLPWKELGVDVVIESTGAFRDEEGLKNHITAGAKGVVLSAPLKDGDVPTYIISVNSQDYGGENIISNASCTTNCITPVARIMMEAFGVEKAMMTTIHGYTSDQRLQDGGHKDLRRARAAALNIIPTSTGAADAASKAIPELEGIFDGLAIRVPVPVGSLSDFTFVLKKNTTKEEINNAFKKAEKNPLYKGILETTEDPIVSSDVVGNPHSAIVDLSLTNVVGGNLAKVVAWYDNEYGYANRLVEEAIMVAKKNE